MMETSASRGKYNIPEELMEAHFLAHYGDWNFAIYRATPKTLIRQVLFIWHLDRLVEEYYKPKS
jgi:hypothetical protein